MKTECLNWKGIVNRSGYGFGLVHRVAWETVYGPIPEGMHIDHLCNNRRCMNPAHLELVTPRENQRRRRVRGRLKCKKGHRYVTRDKNGVLRWCLECHRERQRKYRLKKKLSN